MTDEIVTGQHTYAGGCHRSISDPRRYASSDSLRDAPVSIDTSKQMAKEGGIMSAEQAQRSIRCLVAKVGLDGHDPEAHVIARAFRDAGFKMVYSGFSRKQSKAAALRTFHGSSAYLGALLVAIVNAIVL
jgi:hypothetical protein